MRTCQTQLFGVKRNNNEGKIKLSCAAKRLNRLNKDCLGASHELKIELRKSLDCESEGPKRNEEPLPF